MSNNLNAHWIAKYKKELDDLQVSYPEDATKDQLKEILHEAKGKLPKTPRQVKAEVMAVSDKRVEELEARIVQMQEQFSKFMQGQVAGAGGMSQSAITGDDLLKAVLKAADGRQSDYGLLREEYIPAGDEMPKAEVFYLAGPTFNLWGKQIGGTWTAPPLGRKCIKFEQAIGWTTREGSGLRQRRISTYVCKSKTISDWIKSLPEFGKSIYLNVDEAMHSNTPAGDYMVLYNKHYDTLRSMSYKDITNLASSPEYNIPTNMGKTHNDYAVEIAEKRAWMELGQKQVAFEQTIRAVNVQRMVQQAATSAG